MSQQNEVIETENSADFSSEYSRERLFRLFVGPNAEIFLQLNNDLNANKKPKSYNWVAFFFPIPWLFYRKMYLWGLAILLVPVILYTVFPDLPDASIAIGVVFLLLGNQFYVESANKKIKKIEALGLSPEERDERIRSTGGVSKTGAIFGGIIMLSLIAIVVLNYSAR
ncbi:DUF2628 domain-containing protein [Sneathiella glossodoripedis]|uniref:DUF2628 domain-containing protein n=1 Tax=Sneathiella glossodoripedis TaxID=418853 RepID=UPI00046F884A|nr:DUF2628 domain-containing protein [Sneathiella glossodoripedis]